MVDERMKWERVGIRLKEINLYSPRANRSGQGLNKWNYSPMPLVSRPRNTTTFVASATASSSLSDDDAMSVTSWRRSDKEIDAVPPPPFGLMGVAGDLCVARRRRCPCITSSSLLDLPSQALSANIIVFMGRDTSQLQSDIYRLCITQVSQGLP